MREVTETQPEGEQPKGGHRDPEEGRNIQTGQPTAEGSERVERDGAERPWGVLPKYMGFLKQHGGAPDVPPRYRRLLEAYLKKANEKRAGSDRASDK